VNILIKGDSCCGDDEGADQDGCCKDENTVIANTADFTIKNLTNYNLFKVCCDIPTRSLQYSVHQVIFSNASYSDFMESPPPGKNINPVIATTVIRV